MSAHDTPPNEDRPDSPDRALDPPRLTRRRPDSYGPQDGRISLQIALAGQRQRPDGQRVLAASLSDFRARAFGGTFDPRIH